MSAPRGAHPLAALLMLAAVMGAGAGLSWANTATFGPSFVRAAPPGRDGRYVAGMELLTDQPDFLGQANAALSTLHASTVYLYVAYHGQAFFPLPAVAQRAGLTEVADLLPAALAAFRRERFRVVLVISSALLDQGSASPQGKAMLQPGSDVISPLPALPVVAAMVRVLARYRPAGIYVGEPFTWPGDPPIPAADWVTFYRGVRQAAGSVPLVMLLPTDRDEYRSIYATYGAPLDRALARSHLFAALGIDAEGMVPRTRPGLKVTRHWLRDAPVQFAVASRRLGGSAALDEIPLTNPVHLGQPVPLSLWRRAVRAAARNGIQGIVVFSGEYVGAYGPAQQLALGQALEGFLRGEGMPLPQRQHGT